MAVNQIQNNAEKIAQIDREIAKLTQTAKNLDTYIRNNIYDAADAREAEAELDEVEHKIRRLQQQRLALVSTKPQPANAQKTPAHPLSPIELKELNELRTQYKILDDRLYKLDERIFACDVNMDPSGRHPAIAHQAACDKQEYLREWDELQKQIGVLAARIKQLESRLH